MWDTLSPPVSRVRVAELRRDPGVSSCNVGKRCWWLPLINLLPRKVTFDEKSEYVWDVRVGFAVQVPTPTFP